MKGLVFSIILILSFTTHAQTPLPHGMVFGSKPDTSAIVDATKITTFMGTKIRVSTTVRGKVIKVNKQKGGWFELDAGKGRIISAHFKNYGVMLPLELKGRVVIIEGVAAKQINSAEGQLINGAKVTTKGNSSAVHTKLGFEVTGLMVYK